MAWRALCLLRSVNVSPNQEPEGPSAWKHRIPVIALAVLGCAVSIYLTLYQWHALVQVWDPIFGSAALDGS
jgi:hypothetical protein